MRRIFGTKKATEPPPTMDQAVDKLNTRGDGWVLVLPWVFGVQHRWLQFA